MLSYVCGNRKQIFLMTSHVGISTCVCGNQNVFFKPKTLTKCFVGLHLTKV